MNILLVGHVPPDVGGKDHGGVAQHLWELAHNLDKENEVQILALGRYYDKTKVKDGILIHGFDKSKVKWIKCLANLPSLLLKVGIAPSAKINLLALNSMLRLSAMEEVLQNVDIIHVHGWKDMIMNALDVLSIDVPRVITIHSYHGFIPLNESKRKKRIAYINRYLENVDGLIHVSEADRTKGETLGLVFNGEDHIVHNGIQVSFNYKTGCEKRLCFVGSLIPRKRIKLLLDSLRNLSSDIEKVDIIGEGPQKNVVIEAAKNNPRITYHGVLPNTEVKRILRKSSVLVVPSVSESFGLAYIEALFEGAAVVGYAPTVIEFQKIMNLSDLEKQLVVPFPSENTDSSHLAEKISAAHTFRMSPEGDQTMENVRERAIEYFGWDSAVKKIETVYEKSIAHNHHQRS